MVLTGCDLMQAARRRDSSTSTGNQLDMNAAASATTTEASKGGTDQQYQFAFQFCIPTRSRKIGALDRAEASCRCTFVGVEPSQKPGGLKRAVIIEQNAINGYSGMVGIAVRSCQDDNLAADGSLECLREDDATAVERATANPVEEDAIKIIIDFCPQPGPGCRIHIGNLRTQLGAGLRRRVDRAMRPI